MKTLSKILLVTALAAVYGLADKAKAQDKPAGEHRVTAPKIHDASNQGAALVRPALATRPVTTAPASAHKPKSPFQFHSQPNAASVARYHHELTSEFADGETKFLHLVSDSEP